MTNESTITFQGWTLLKGDVAVYWPVVEMVLAVEARRPSRQPDGTEWPGDVWQVLPTGRCQTEPSSLLTKDERAYLKDHRDALVTILTYQLPAVV